MVRARGFTLIELITILVILAVLLALLLPFLNSRQYPEGLLCSSSLKQLATAAAMYATDYDNQYPHAGLTCLDPTQPDGSPGCEAGALVRPTYERDDQMHPNRYGYGETWQGGGLAVLYPYTKNWGVYWCGSMGSVVPTPTDPKSYYNGFEWLKSPNRVRYPQSKVLLIEAFSFHDQKGVGRLDDPPNPKRRHNIAFVDGHVKSVDLSTGCSGNPDPSCAGWESCLGSGGNGNYVCSGFGKGVGVPDFPVKNTGLMLKCLALPPQ